MDLILQQFERLISNLFQKMGLETRLTQASRDGGVDCVAYDPRPIFGGKVVIQAKRYKHTVGVSAVRDLFGTCKMRVHRREYWSQQVATEKPPLNLLRESRLSY